MPTLPANAVRNTTPRIALSPATRPRPPKAIIAAVESDEPPAFLLLGNDALKTYRRLATARLDTMEAWEHLTTSTDIGA
jgi:hypothetical protein